MCSTDAQSRPIVLIVYGGDQTTLETVVKAIEKNTPVIIVKVSVFQKLLYEARGFNGNRGKTYFMAF